MGMELFVKWTTQIYTAIHQPYLCPRLANVVPARDSHNVALVGW